MRNISEKPTTFRWARAEGFLEAPPEVLQRVREGRLQKGDALAVARMTAILWAKNLTTWIPDCHSIPLTHVDCGIRVEETGIRVQVTARAIARTGVEMEVLTGTCGAHLTLYDYLKPETDQILIREIRLLEKHGGKSDFSWRAEGLSAMVLVISDRVAAGEEDRTGPLIQAFLEELGFRVRRKVVPDEEDQIRAAAEEAKRAGVDLLITAGGTGPGKRDRTVRALRPLLEKELPGIVERARAYGGERTPLAMLGGGTAGWMGETLVVMFPGSPRAARDYLNALFPALIHALEARRGQPH